jgi:hypothetical protein
VLGQGVFDSPSLTLVIGANIFKQILNTFKVIRYILGHLVIFLHNKVDKTYQGGNFQEKKKFFLKSPT